MVSTSDLQAPERRQLRQEYTARINRVVDYIEQHLAEDLGLDQLARIACFSSFHFHRIFSAMQGETLHQFIARLRVEKAAGLLVRNPQLSITEIALDCGFSGSATFARAFRESFGMTATEWRAGGHASVDKPDGVSTVESSADEPGILSQRLDRSTGLPRWQVGVTGKEPVEVHLEQVPDLTVAYLRYTGRYQGMSEVFEDLFGRLMRWAGPRGLCGGPAAQVLATYHDSPGITDDDKLRVSACLTVPDGTTVSGDVGRTVVAGGLCAFGRFELNDQEYPLAWRAMICGWLPESGFQPDDRLFYERYPPSTGEEAQGCCPVDICVPVRPL